MIRITSGHRKITCSLPSGCANKCGNNSPHQAAMRGLSGVSRVESVNRSIKDNRMQIALRMMRPPIFCVIMVRKKDGNHSQN